MHNPKFTEDTLSEQPAIEQLKRLGYSYVHDDALDPDQNDKCERASRKEVILLDRLRKKLKEINPHLTPQSIDKAIRKITHVQAEGLIETNKIIHHDLIAGVSISQEVDGRRQHQTVRFIDFENTEKNEFLAVNQFSVKGKEPGRPDIIIFVNGIPLVVIECKSPVAKETGIKEAIHQLARYQNEIAPLFHTNAFVIGCNLLNAKYGVIGNEESSFQDWKDPSSGRKLKGQEILIEGLLSQKNLLDILQNFIVFDYSREEHRIVKKIARYPQFLAVNKITRRVTEETDKCGIVWHWQGSGKSLIMVFTAIKLRREEKKLKNPTVLIVTDRTKLDRQITEQFQNCGFPNPIRARSSKKLYELLKSGTGATVMTTVQKFKTPLADPLSKAHNIIVLTDEAHRTQYGSFALNMRKALPNASFFAFTGTPLDKRDRNTYRHFSPPGERYLDRYTMKQSLEDGTTKVVKYQSRMANLQIVGRTIDHLLKEMFPEKSETELSGLKKKYVNVETLLSAPRRIELIARDIVEHFTTKALPEGFKAQIVAADRKAAVLYKEALDRLIEPSWSTVIMTVSNDDLKEWKEKYRRTAEEEDRITGKEVFQNPKDPLKILIVAEKLTTGFDAPILQVMYLDQRMKEHTLLQTIARTNRPYPPRKHYGLVVDYVGVGQELSLALSIFDKTDLEGLFSVDDLKRELEILKEHHAKAMAFFRRINLSGKPEKVLQQCLEIIEPEDVRAEFDDLFRAMTKSIDILMPDPSVEPFLKDFKFLGMVREAARNLYRDERLTLEDCSRKIENLIHAHIRDMGVEEILAPINISAPDFKEQLDVKGSPKAKASHIEHAMRQEISEKLTENPVFYGSLQDQLETMIKEYKLHRKDEATLLRELMALRDQEERQAVIAKTKGLSEDEFAFYGLWEPHSDNLFKGDDKKRCIFTRELVQIILGRTVIDWVDKPDILREMRRGVKKVLKDAGIKDGKIDSFTREIMELAKVKFKDRHGNR
ncbi:MAG: type I restriction endonuclease subunit R [Candidatus Omnitrophica bacterium]|nr:type I restriction endonuclease subunit R [Candidatus Omnitrophota bacterium]